MPNIKKRGLRRFDLAGLRRILRAVRIGLAMPHMPGDTVHRVGDHGNEPPGSDGQLMRKLAAIRHELARRGGQKLVEQIMDDESDDMDGPAESEMDLPTECAYPGCIQTGKGKDGMCIKHTIALGRGDKEAMEAARQFHAVRDRQPEPPHDAHWRATRKSPTRQSRYGDGAAESGRRKAEPEKETTQGGAKPPPEQPTTKTGETTMPEKITCKKCGREFDPRGFAGHGPTCQGPDGGKTGPRCPDCGKRTKNDRGLICHYSRTGHGGGAKAIDKGQLTRDNARRPRRAEAIDGPGKTGPTCQDCGKQFDSERGLNCHFGQTGHGGGAERRAARRKQRNARRYDAIGPGAVKCTVCGRRFKSEHSLGCHWGKSACGGGKVNSGTGNREPGTRKKNKAEINDALAFFNRGHPGSGFRVPGSAVSSSPPDGIAAAGHAFMRLAELLGLAGQIVDCPHPEGRCFVNSANGKAAIVAPDGSIRAAEVIAR